MQLSWKAFGGRASVWRAGVGRTATWVAPTASPNELTAIEDRDPFVGNPWHKHVPARVERVGS